MSNLSTPSIATDQADSTSGVTLLDPDRCYRALCAKDSRFDGEFFVGVASTKIYCRPVCHAKTPRASSCRYYTSASAAEAAGYRPCLRCRPELAPYALQQNLAYAVWQRIMNGALNDNASMQDLADQIGLSTRQLQRLMQQHFGVSPVELAQTARLLFAKKLLQETTLTMSDVAFSSGFGSVRRFNALFVSRYGMQPSLLRRSLPASTTSNVITLRLAYRAPFAWDTLLNYLQVRAIGGVESVQPHGKSGKNERCYVRSVRYQRGGSSLEGWLRVSHLKKEQQLAIELGSHLAPVLMPVLAQLRRQFDLDANPVVIESHLRADPLIAQQISRTPGLRVPGAFNNFELATRAVLGQQISVTGASTLAARLVQRFGATITTPLAGVTHHFPEPAELAQMSAENLAQIGLPRARAETIVAVAKFAADGGLNIVPGTPLKQAIDQLKTVRGIGEWTAQYIALRALRYPDAFPGGDLGLQKAATPPDAERRLTEPELLNHVSMLSPWRGYAAIWLWQSITHH